ncbi:MAG: TldD/PmbA family protein [Vigna little leaf phytoplasma]|nr:TldD/PmbA family protein [Vigna little leaf phytoplasma]
MLTKAEIQDILIKSLSNGVDFVELFFEDNTKNFSRIINNEVVFIQSENIYGVGIRLLNKTDEIYLYTNKVNYEHILNLILEQKKIWNSDEKNNCIPLKEAQYHKINVTKPFKSISLSDKMQKLLHLSQIIKEYDTRIIKSIVSLEEKEQKVLIANSLGVYQTDFRPYIRCMLIGVAKEGDNIQEFSDNVGYSIGLEIFEMIDFEAKARMVAQKAIVLLSAQELKPQKMSVVINKGVGGVIFHEACGHSLEATSVAKGLSPFVNKLNQKIASELVTAYDDGTIEGAWGQLNYDDEGRSTQKNLLIEKGILKNYLIDYRNSLKMKMLPTGSGRRQSYKYSPTSRMNSTYIAAGTDTPAQIIQDTKYGFYAESLGGGTVVPATGEFNFMVKLGYLIEDGHLTIPIKGMMLIGKGQEILLQIDRVANDLAFDQGYCGSLSGYVPVDLGQPTIRVKEMIIGGITKGAK